MSSSGGVPHYSEGIHGNAAVILKDGVPMLVGDVVSALNKTIPAPEVAALAREIAVLNHAICSYLRGAEWELSRSARREINDKIAALLKLAEGIADTGAEG